MLTCSSASLSAKGVVADGVVCASGRLTSDSRAFALGSRGGPIEGEGVANGRWSGASGSSWAPSNLFQFKIPSHLPQSNSHFAFPPYGMLGVLLWCWLNGASYEQHETAS